MRTRFMLVFVMGLVGATLAPWASGQNVPKPNPDRINAIKAKLAQISDRYSKLSAHQRMLLDGEKRLGLSPQAVDKLAAAASAGMSITRKQFSDMMADAQKNAGIASVSDPSTDLDFSAYDGLTQSETHTAMCGNQVVVGFNDSGSVIQSFFFGSGGLSFSGAAVSSDGGKTFHDIGFMNPGPDINNFLSGDPLLTCTDSTHFVYTQLFETGTGSAVGISSSSDGGNTWSDPQPAVLKDFSHFLDKPWTAIDPSNTQRVYITYTDFDGSGTSPGCGLQSRTAIELVVSNDGGQHFGSPSIIDEQCGDNVGVQTSHVAFNSHSVAYIAWHRFNPTNVEVRVSHLSPGGSPVASIAVDQKVFGGDVMLVEGGSFFLTLDLEEDLQGRFRNLSGLDLAVDHTGGLNDGAVYVTWDDGRNKSTSDLAGFSLEGNPPNQPAVLVPFSPLILTAGTYFYTDIMLSRSKDGVHFSPTSQVNSDRQPKFGGGHDHFQPAIAVDPTGKVAICWYDRRNDPRNFNIERFCAESKNSGNDWVNFRVPIAPFAPLHRMDFGLAGFGEPGVNPAYMGDYDGLTTDFTGKTSGFIGAFEWMSSGMNPDVKAFFFQ
ncbi:MAG TPA: sialidase family protein [Candidatus Angelobacter sp.]|nr:sialidase family protein [Candidatus Angelobacter sp.]